MRTDHGRLNEQRTANARSQDLRVEAVVRVARDCSIRKSSVTPKAVPPRDCRVTINPRSTDARRSSIRLSLTCAGPWRFGQPLVVRNVYVNEYADRDAEMRCVMAQRGGNAFGSISRSVLSLDQEFAR